MAEARESTGHSTGFFWTSEYREVLASPQGRPSMFRLSGG